MFDRHTGDFNIPRASKSRDLGMIAGRSLLSLGLMLMDVFDAFLLQPKSPQCRAKGRTGSMTL